MDALAGFHVVYTVLIFIAFIGVVVWAYSRRRRDDFDEAARLPFADETPADDNPADNKKERP